MNVTDTRLDRLEERVGELLAASCAAQVDFSDYADDPVRFMREVLGFTPWSKQVEVCRAVLDGKRVVVHGHHAAGKDAVLAALLLWACYTRDMLCIIVSATERQVIGQVWTELARMWTGAGCFAGELYVGELRIGGEKRIIAMTSASTSNLTGWHNHRGSGVFVGISESQAEQVGAVAFDAAEGNTAGEGSKVLVVGNPVKASGRFYEVSHKPTWQAIRISAFDHPNIVEKRVVIPGGPAPGWPEEMAAEYGESSPFYISRVLGDWPTEGSIDSLIRLEWLERAYERHEAGDGQLKPYPLPVAALDVARSWDRDFSVAAIAQGARLDSLTAWRSRDLVDTAARFTLLADRERLSLWARTRHKIIEPSSAVWSDCEEIHTWCEGRAIPSFTLIIDAPGVGGGICDELARRHRVAKEYWGWSPARNGQRFANVRAEVYWGLRKLLEDGEAELPRDAKLHEEALSMEWTEDAKNRIVMVSKDDLRKALKRSPDRLDAATIALAESVGYGPRPPTVSFTPVSI